MSDVQIVLDQDSLAECCAAWRKQGWFCFDTEFIRDETFIAELCFVQVHDGARITLIDPMVPLDMAPFWELVTSPDVMAIVHAGKEDFDVCLRATGLPPRNVFDVQIASGFAGTGYPMSLARLVQALLKKRLSKGQTLTDWARRPLTDEQLTYAADDVRYLPALHRKLTDRLEKNGRLGWATEEFAKFERPEMYRPPTEDRLFKLKGSKRLDALGLAVLRDLVEWREEWAIEKNRPIRAMVRDDVLVEIAKRRPTKMDQLEVLRGFPQARNPRIVKEVLRRIEHARNTDPKSWPTPYQPREDTPMIKVTLDLMSAFLRATCYVEALDAELVGSSQKLRDLLDHLREPGSEEPLLMQGWRAEFIGRRLEDLLNGRCELHLSGGPQDPHLHVVSHDTE